MSDSFSKTRKLVHLTSPNTGQTHGPCDFGYLDIWIFGYLGIWIFGYFDIWDFRIFGYLDIWIFGIWGFGGNWKKIIKVVFALVRQEEEQQENMAIYLDIWIFAYLDIWIFEYLDNWIFLNV